MSHLIIPPVDCSFIQYCLRQQKPRLLHLSWRVSAAPPAGGLSVMLPSSPSRSAPPRNPTSTAGSSASSASVGATARSNSRALPAGPLQPEDRTGLCALGTCIHPFPWAQASRRDGRHGGRGVLDSPGRRATVVAVKPSAGAVMWHWAPCWRRAWGSGWQSNPPAARTRSGTRTP